MSGDIIFSNLPAIASLAPPSIHPPSPRAATATPSVDAAAIPPSVDAVADRVFTPFVPAPGPGSGWFPFAYRLDAFSGTGLATGADSPARPLVLDLKLTGRHRLHIAQNPGVRAWLDGDAGYVQLPSDPSTVRDIAFPAADLTGRRLHLAPVRGAGGSRELTLFYIRAEPCGEEPGRRNLIATNDGHGVFHHGLDMARDLYRHVYPFSDGDFFRLVWGVYGGSLLTMRPDTRAGESPIRNDETHFYAGDRQFSRSLQRLQAEGADPLAVVRRATRDCGLELHYYIRMSAFYGPFPHMGWTTRFFRDHPEWHCRDEAGRPIPFLSYAYPQVQERMLAFFTELLEYGPEGLCLAFNRGLPLMVCEEPVLEAFHRRHGRRPRLPEDAATPEFLAVRHEMLADFVEHVHRLAASRGKSVSCIVPRDFDRVRRHGLDPDGLVRRGLVESVMVGAGHGDKPALNADLAPVLALKAGGARVYAGGSSVGAHGLAWVNHDLKARARHMASILDAGLDGGWFWDAESVIGPDWEAMRRFGTRERLAGIMDGTWPPPSTHETLAIHDLTVGPYNPWHSY